MTRVYPNKRKDPNIKTTGTRGFNLGLNQLTHPTTIKDNELAESQNTHYSQNGVLAKRPGSSDIGIARGDSTIINSLEGVYSIDGTNYLLRISDDGVLQSYNFVIEVWTDVSGSPTFSDVESTILQAYGYVYILNTVDDMVKWDGTTFHTFTALADPTSAPAVAKVGTGAGEKTYYYRYVWFNDVGNTLASDNDSIADMPSLLDSDTYITVTVPTAPAGTTKTGIFKGTIEGEETFMAWIPASQLVYEDKGYDPEDPLYGVPLGNTTGGFHFKTATVYMSTLVGVTTEEGEDTLVFSGGGDKFDSFGRADGGGYYSWRKGDGDPISGIEAFQDELYVFKTRKIGAFKFDEQGGTIRDINLAVGAVSQKSIHPAGNDLRFWAQDGAMSMGNEPNFADLIRTKVLSARADKIVQSLSPSEFSKISGVYYKNISMWGIPTGEAGSGITSVLAYDERYVAWSEWLGLTPNCWAKFIDPNGYEKLYFGDSTSGNVVQAWQGTSDNGNPIVWRVATKQFDMDRPHQYKTFYRVYFIFGQISGTATRITLVEDGQRSQIPMALYADQGDTGFGVDEWGTMAWGESSGEFSGDTTGLTVRYIDLGSKDLFSLQAILSNDGIKDNLEFMGIMFEYRESSRPLPSSKKLSRVYA